MVWIFPSNSSNDVVSIRMADGVQPSQRAVRRMTDTDDEKKADDYFAGMDAYDRSREEARLRAVADSMDRALGRGKLTRNPPVQENRYSPHRW